LKKLKSIAQPIYKNFSHVLQRGGFFIAAMVMAMAIALPAAADSQQDNRQAAFKAAAQEFGVPENLLLAVSYHKSRWETHNGKPSASGGYGLMHLVGAEDGQDGRGDDASHKVPTDRKKQVKETLDDAAATLQVSKETLQQDERQNIRGGAALLAKYAKAQHNGSVPTSENDWYGAVTEYSDSDDAAQATEFADEVFGTLQHGAARKTTDNQTLQLGADGTVKANKSDVDQLERSGRLHRTPRPKDVECPSGLNCKFVPARYAQNNPSDPADYGNYDQANRPKDMKITSIIIHDTEGSYDASIAWFQDPASYTSAHYVIRSADGEVTQMVKTKDVAWHAGNWYANMHSIGVEHEGFSKEGAAWYTEEMYRASAKLVRYLAEKYDIPLDRQHIIGHDQFHAPTPATVAGMHTDPGPFWDWEHYMELLHAPVEQNGSWRSSLITIAPKFDTNKPLVNDCSVVPCENLPSQSANFVYMRIAPEDGAQLVKDAGLHPDGTNGTPDIADTSARATYGEQFVVAERQGDWTAVWFNGQKAWFKNPVNWWQRTAVGSKGRVVTPKPGLASVPLYGRAYPESSAYPATITPQAITPLPYAIPAGQQYPMYGKASIDYLYAMTFDNSLPDDHTVVVGNEKYYLVSYNQREGYVKASDVEVSYLN